MDENHTQETISGEGPTEWKCFYCPSIATTMRQGSPVCYHHALHLSPKKGLAKRILSKLREGSSH